MVMPTWVVTFRLKKGKTTGKETGEMIKEKGRNRQRWKSKSCRVRFYFLLQAFFQIIGSYIKIIIHL